MSLNDALAATLHEMAALLQLTGADSFRANAHSRAARGIEGLSTDIGAIAEDRAALMRIEGVGAGMADKIQEFARTGAIQEHVRLQAEVPPGVLALLSVPGLGPKTVRTLWQEGGITGPEALRKALDGDALAGLPRMGAKTVDNIRKALAFQAQGDARMRLGDALPIAEAIVARMLAIKGVAGAQFAGSMRRGMETVGDIDIVVAATGGAAARASEAFRAMPEVSDVLVAGDTKSSVRIALPHSHGAAQADLRVVEPRAFGAALLYFTGSKAHNVRLRQRALKRAMTLNEYGLFPNDSEDTPPQDRGVTPVAADTEESIYAALSLPWVPPELREDRGEADAAPGHDWGLIELADIRAELHAHTTASDGALSIDALAAEAKRRGFHTIAVTDHSKSQPIAGGLSPERLLAHIEAIHAARARITGIAILAGSEVDILADGSLDYDDALLRRLDIVVASPHSALKQNPEEATRRLVRAASHPLVHIIGHPTGRYINRREGMSPDIAAVARAAAEHKTALEINANAARLDLRDSHVRIALDAGCDISIDCDVHNVADFDQLRYGVSTARRAALSPERCVNAWSAERLGAWLKAKR